MTQENKTKRQIAASRKHRREALLARMGWRMKKPRTGRVEVQSDESPIVDGITPYVNGYLEGYMMGRNKFMPTEHPSTIGRRYHKKVSFLSLGTEKKENILSP